MATYSFQEVFAPFFQLRVPALPVSVAGYMVDSLGRVAWSYKVVAYIRTAWL